MNTENKSVMGEGKAPRVYVYKVEKVMPRFFTSAEKAIRNAWTMAPIRSGVGLSDEQFDALSIEKANDMKAFIKSATEQLRSGDIAKGTWDFAGVVIRKYLLE